MKHLTLCFLGILLAGCAASIGAAAPEDETQAHTISNDDFVLPYRIHIPPNLPEGQKVPLVLFLHGAGERGDDNARQMTHGIPSLLDYFKNNNQPAILLIPQCPADKRWVEVHWGDKAHTMPATPSVPMQAVLKLLKQTMQELPVDPRRVYVTGISMGGFGTWDIIQREPDLFAAALPICGGGDTAQAARLANLPVWAFHGQADQVVIPERSRDMIAAIKQAGGRPIHTEYPGVAHVSWTQTYNNRAVLDWLFAQKNPAHPVHPVKKAP